MAYQLTVTPKDKPYNEIQNYSAFSAIKSDGSVVAWGGGVNGGDIPSDIATQLTNVKQIFSSGYAFAALKNDGSVVSWGTDGNNSPINTPNMTNVKTISSTETAFAALTNDGNVVAWGNADKGGSVISLTDVKEIYANNSAFAALKNDGSVVTWGDTNAGGSSSGIVLSGVDKIFSTRDAFAALKTDGSVVAWGSISSVPDSIFNPSNQDFIPVKEVYATDATFTALREDGSVVTWGGDTNIGAVSSELNASDPIKKVINIFSNSESFTSLRADGVLINWGGENSKGVIDSLKSEKNLQIFSNVSAFAALKDDGSVVTWGYDYVGGAPKVYQYDGDNAVNDDDTGFPIILKDVTNDLQNVKTIFSNNGAFAALKNDGSVITWGKSSYGGDSSSIATQLINVKKIFITNWGAFAALRVDGSVVTWGSSSDGASITSPVVADQLKSGVVSFANATTDDNYAVLAPQPVVIENYAPTGSVSITGTPTQGQVLTVSNTLADANGMGAVSYQWFNNSGAIQSATQTTFTLTQADVGKTFSVTASYTDGAGFSTSVASASTTAVANVNDLPTGAVVISGKAMQGETLSVSNTLTDIDGLGAITYQWQSNGKDIVGATQPTYALTKSDVNNVISVKANYIDGFGAKESVIVQTEKVINVNALPTGSVLIDGIAKQSETLTVSNTLADTDGLGAISYQWQRSGSDIPSATQSTYVLTQADVDKTISVKVSYIDKYDVHESVSSASIAKIINVNDTPTGTISILGTATQNQTLTANIDTLVDLDGIGNIAYQWQRSSTDIPSATGSTYVLTQADVNQSISVKASYSDKFGTSESVSSVATAKIVDVNDKPSGRVSISGTTAQNHTLTTSNDLSDLDGLGPISYQWSRNNVDILNATQATYALTQIDVGKVVTVKASYTDGLGKLESVIGGFFSHGLDPLTIANENDSPKGTVSITGMAKKGHVLSVSNTLTDVDGLGEVHYQWLNEGNVIADANQASYALTQADVGKNISVKASYTDLQNTNESLASTALRIAANKAPTGAITLKGSPVWGATLSASSILKDGDGLGKLSYSWQNEAGELSTSPSYRLGEDDIDTNVWLTVQYTDKKGNIEEVNSKPVDVKISKKSSAYNDILEGTAAADTLSGLGGNDTLVGGAGSDKLTGGKGSDIFVFTSLDFYTTDSNGGLVFNKSVDTVTDFNLKAYDMLDFGDLGELSFYPSLKDAQDDLASLFYVKGSGKIYLNTNNADGFTPTVIVILTGKPAVNADFTDWNYPAV